MDLDRLNRTSQFPKFVARQFSLNAVGNISIQHFGRNFDGLGPLVFQFGGMLIIAGAATQQGECHQQYVARFNRLVEVIYASQKNVVERRTSNRHRRCNTCGLCLKWRWQRLAARRLVSDPSQRRKKSAEPRPLSSPRPRGLQNSTWPAPLAGRGTSAVSVDQEPCGSRLTRNSNLTLTRQFKLSNWPYWAGDYLLGVSITLRTAILGGLRREFNGVAIGTSKINCAALRTLDLHLDSGQRHWWWRGWTVPTCLGETKSRRPQPMKRAPRNTALPCANPATELTH